MKRFVCAMLCLGLLGQSVSCIERTVNLQEWNLDHASQLCNNMRAWIQEHKEACYIAGTVTAVAAIITTAALLQEEAQEPEQEEKEDKDDIFHDRDNQKDAYIQVNWREKVRETYQSVKQQAQDTLDEMCDNAHKEDETTFDRMMRQADQAHNQFE